MNAWKRFCILAATLAITGTGFATRFVGRQKGLHIECDTGAPLTVYGMFFDDDPTENCLCGTAITTEGEFLVPAFAIDFRKIGKGGSCWIEAIDPEGDIVKARLVFRCVYVDAEYQADASGWFQAPLPEGGGPYVILWGDGTQSSEIVDLSPIERRHAYRPGRKGKYRIYVPLMEDIDITNNH